MDRNFLRYQEADDEDFEMQNGIREEIGAYLGFIPNPEAGLSTRELLVEFRGNTSATFTLTEERKTQLHAGKKGPSEAELEEQVKQAATARVDEMLRRQRARLAEQLRKAKQEADDCQRRAEEAAAALKRQNQRLHEHRLQVLQGLVDSYAHKPDCYGVMYDKKAQECVGNGSRGPCLLRADCALVHEVAPTCLGKHFNRNSSACLGPLGREQNKHCLLAGLCATKSGHFPG